MTETHELQQVNRTLWLWQAYDPKVKSDLFSTAALGASGVTLVDPIPLAPAALAELTGRAKIAGILVTNSNHRRASDEFAAKFGVPTFSREQLTKQAGGTSILLETARSIGSEITPLPIKGAPPGETAFHFRNDGGTIVLGDAILHLEPYGFALLPAKYCSDQKAMRRSLCQLLDWPFERLFFAHGRPIVSAARERLETLLR